MLGDEVGVQLGKGRQCASDDNDDCHIRTMYQREVAGETPGVSPGNQIMVEYIYRESYFEL